MRTKTILGVLALIVFAMIDADRAFSQYDDEMLKKMEADEELQQEFKWLKAETYVITASRVMEEIKKAPASITVITDRQIRQMGARHLTDVLRTVPGMQPWYYFLGTHKLNVRRGGGGGLASNRVLILLNGHPLNATRSGGATGVHDTLALDNVKRIEVIRGPGSALYGANAFLGVINVITKDAEDIDGFELTARGGSWDTQQYNLLFGKTFSELEVAFNLNYFKTHGFRGLIEEDFQTWIDQQWPDIYYPNVSLAPGRMAGNDEKYEVALNLKYKGFTFDGRYVDRERELPVSGAAALNHKSIADTVRYYLIFSYERSIWEGLNLSGKVYRNFGDTPFYSQILPPGYVTETPTGFEVMPEGRLQEQSLKDSRTGVEIQATYQIIDSNTVVAGVTYEELKQYEITTKANYLPPPNFLGFPSVIIPLPSVQEWPDEYTEDTEKINFKAVFLEDIWDITDDIRLTTGVRYDRYSNFGGEASPSVGLTWEYVEGYDLKLLYGHAFRAPSFQELFDIISGNPDLDPEERDRYAVSLGADFNPSLSTRITGYYSKGKNTILQDPQTQVWINYGKSRIHGFEVEMKYDFGRGTYLAGNYAYSSTPVGKRPTEDYRNWTSPRHVGNIMANIRLSKQFNFYANCHLEDGFKRDFADDRDDMSGYAILDSTLIARKFLKSHEGLEFRASVYNLLDKDYVSPSDPRLPNDLPRPGINYLLEFKYTF